MKNRTLNRPMFRRGGKVDSRGTGITSGLMPRKNYAQGDLVLPTTVPGIAGPGGFGNALQGKQLLSQLQFGGDYPLTYYGASDKPNVILKDTSDSAIQELASKLGKGDIAQSTFESNLENIEQIKQQNIANAKYMEAVETQKRKEKDIKTNIEVDNLNKILKDLDPSGPEYDAVLKEINEKKDSVITEEPVVDVEGTPEQKPEEEPNINLGKITDEIDFDDIEADIERKGEFYERLLKRDKKGQIFDALTAAAPELLEEDYGGAIEKAGEKLKDDTKREATLLAIQESITNQNKETDDKKINSVAKTLFNSGEYGNMKEAKAAATKIVYRVTQDKPNKYDDSQNILNQIASINDSGNTHERDNKESYAFSRVKYANNPELFTLAQYTKKDPTKADSPYESNINTLINSPTNKGKIIIDPEKNIYISVNKQGQIKEFSNSVEAEAHLKT